MQKPSWVPDWAWKEYEETRTAFVAIDGVARAMDRIMTEPDCECVWKALERRRSTWDTKIALATTVRDTLRPFLQDRYQPTRGPACHLLQFVEQALWNSARQRFTPTERTHIANRVAKLANELRDEIGHIVDSQYVYGEFGSPIQEFGATCALTLAHHFPDAFPDEWMINCASDAAYWAGTSYWRLLEAYAKGAANWAEEEPLITQSGSPTAERLAFMRQLTAYFRDIYEKPLRKQVAVLTSAVFNCDMDANTVHKLAP